MAAFTTWPQQSKKCAARAKKCCVSISCDCIGLVCPALPTLNYGGLNDRSRSATLDVQVNIS
jgi:hypothetical protein